MSSLSTGASERSLWHLGSLGQGVRHTGRACPGSFCLGSTLSRDPSCYPASWHLSLLNSTRSASGTFLGTSPSGEGVTWPFSLAGQASNWSLQTSANQGLAPTSLLVPTVARSEAAWVSCRTMKQDFSPKLAEPGEALRPEGCTKAVWQHPCRAPRSCWAQIQRLHMAHNAPRDQPPLPSPTPPPRELGNPCHRAHSS